MTKSLATNLAVFASACLIGVSLSGTGAAVAKAATTPPTNASKTAPKTAQATAKKKGATGPAGSAAADDKEVPVSPPPAGSSPMADLKKANGDLDKVIKKKAPPWSPEAEAQKAELRKLVGGFLDYRELARRALAKHWDTLTPAKQQEFVTTLRGLVERSYLGQLRGDPNYTIKYSREEKEGSEAKVWATLATTARGKKVNIALEYRLIYRGRWLVYDVVTDEQSMLENYRAEFNKIINKEGFDALLKRMKKKLEEQQKEQ